MNANDQSYKMHKKPQIYNANVYESLKVARELWYLLNAYGCK